MDRDKSFSVEAVTGGWLLTWRDPSKDQEYETVSGLGLSLTSAGREIFTSKKKLIERIKTLI